MMRYLKQYKFLLFLTVLFTAISSLSYVFIAILLQQVMDIVDMGDMDGFIRILLFSLKRMKGKCHSIMWRAAMTPSFPLPSGSWYNWRWSAGGRREGAIAAARFPLN